VLRKHWQGDQVSWRGLKLCTKKLEFATRYRSPGQPKNGSKKKKKKKKRKKRKKRGEEYI